MPPPPSPQVPIFNIMRKFDGSTITDDIRLGRRRMRILRLPPFLCMHMRRFTKNNFFTEKNPTIVNFPVKNLELRDILPLPEGGRCGECVPVNSGGIKRGWAECGGAWCVWV